MSKQAENGIPPPWFPVDPGDVLEGTLIRYEETTAKFGPVSVAVLDVPDDGERSVYLAKVLKQSIREARMQPGDPTRITYLGRRQKSDGTWYHDYRVERRSDTREAETTI